MEGSVNTYKVLMRHRARRTILITSLDIFLTMIKKDKIFESIYMMEK